MTRIALVGRPGPLPLVGYLAGELAEDGRYVGWAGRIGGADDVEGGYHAARALDRALRRAGPPRADRRRALSILWARLDGVARDVLGPAAGADLVLALVAGDGEGLAVSAVGLDGLLVPDARGALVDWVGGGHPLLGAPGIPSDRPGALSVEADVPAWLIGTSGSRRVAGALVTDVLPQCGVHR